MEPIDYLRGIKRRWLLIPFAIVVGAVAGYVTAPVTSKKTTTYKADVILVTPSTTGGSGSGSVNFDQIDLLVTNGAVPRDAAAQLGIADPADAVNDVTANGDGKKQAVTITAKANDAEQAARTADAFSTALLADLTATATGQRQADLAQAQDQVNKAQAAVNDLGNSGSNLKDPTFQNNRSAAQSKLDTANADLQKLQQEPAPSAPLVALDKARAERVIRRKIAEMNNLADSVDDGHLRGAINDADYRTLFENAARGLRKGDPKLSIATCATPGNEMSALLPLVLNCASSSENEFR